MKKLQLVVCILSLCLSSGIVVAQTNNTTVERKKRPKPMKHDLSGGIRLNTDGWSIFLERGRIKTPDRSTDYFYDMPFWLLEFGEKKHPQETKRNNAVAGGGNNATRPFAYGKISNFYTFKIGYGKRKMIAGKPKLYEDVEKNTVSIHWVYAGGLVAGLEKPYFVDVNGSPVNYTDSTKEIFLNQTAIQGSSGFSEGIGKTKIVPGAHGRTGLSFDFAATKKMKLAIETGVNVEVYARNIEIMANQQNYYPFFVNAYASIQIGKRWAEKK